VFNNKEVTQILMSQMIRNILCLCKTLTMAEVISKISKLQSTEFQTCLFNDPSSVTYCHDVYFYSVNFVILGSWLLYKDFLGKGKGVYMDVRLKVCAWLMSSWTYFIT
jgi:hypothetical protein